MPSERVLINGVELHVEFEHLDRAATFDDPDSGMVPLVMVHGWTADRFRNWPVYQYLAARGWPVVAYDLRGHGSSQKGLGAAAYTLGHCIDDLVALVSTFLATVHGISKIALYGHSMGGTVVLESLGKLATTCVSLERLFLVAPFAGWSPDPDVRAVFEVLLQSYEKRFEKEFARKKREQARLGLQFFPHWDDPSLLPERDVTLALGQELLDHNVPGDVLDAVSVPVHLFVGTRDRLDLQSDARQLASKAGRATLDILPCAHNYAIELHESFPAMIHAYLSGEARESGS